MTSLPIFDGNILASYINTCMRDGMYEDLDDICAAYDVKREEVDRVLSSAGMIWSDESQKVVRL